MTCHRDGARHCSCAPEALPPTALPGEPGLELVSPDPQAHAALRILAAPLEVEVVTTAPGTSRVTGDVGALLRAAAGSLVVAALPPAPAPVELDPPAAAPGDEPADGSVDEPAAQPAPPAQGPLLANLPRRPEPSASLPGREHLLVVLAAELERQEPDSTTGLLFCAVGDGPDTPGSVLGAVAARLRGQLRRSDLLVHLGGGRFAAVVPDLSTLTGEDAAARTVAAVRGALAEPVSTSAGLFPLTTLVGVLLHPGLDDDGAPDSAVPPSAQEMLAVVERAMERGPLPTA